MTRRYSINTTMFNPILKNLKENHSLIIITLPMIAMGLFAGYSLAISFSWDKLLLVCLGYFFINIIGVTAGLHRYFSHKSFKASRGKEILMLYASTLSGQGSPVWWVALHRGYHHRKSDTLMDPHSPIHGFWHSIFLWIFRIKVDSISFRYAVDAMRNKDVMWFSTHYTKIWLISNILFGLISIEFMLFFSMLPAFITLITYNLTNSINHMGFGYSNFNTRDNSKNVIWIWPLVLGECWHNNHHGRPGNYHFGIKWWEFDPSGLFIRVFKDR